MDGSPATLTAVEYLTETEVIYEKPTHVPAPESQSARPASEAPESAEQGQNSQPSFKLATSIPPSQTQVTVTAETQLIPVNRPATQAKAPPLVALQTPSPNPNRASVASAQQTPAPIAPIIFTHGGRTYTAPMGSGFSLNAGYLSPGGPPITDSGTVLSLGPDGSQMLVKDDRGSSTVFLSHAAPASGQNGDLDPSQPSSPVVVTAASHYFTLVSPSEIIFGDASLTPGGSEILASGIPVSFADTGDYLFVGSSSLALPTTQAITIGDRTFTADSASAFVVDGQTLAPGGSEIRVSGTKVSLAPGGTYLLVGATSIPLDAHQSVSTSRQIYTTSNPANLVIDGQTLLPGGPAITVNGTAISLAPGATQVVVGSSTISLVPGATQAIVGSSTHGISPGAGGYIWSEIGGSLAPTSTVAATAAPSGAEIEVYTGTAGTKTRKEVSWVLLVGACLLFQGLHL